MLSYFKNADFKTGKQDMKKAGLKNRRIVDRGIFLFFRKENKK